MCSQFLVVALTVADASNVTNRLIQNGFRKLDLARVSLIERDWL